ncbi:13840_t:CDS:2 [Cetraspora pellucida]|uniref:13840_t:CDS:1 n=1 Tax=Cetraspora pellucida TaxID=1433469 RepID=A0A9N9E633_9GLOM|nr:13840_t:CDS:2 [Cetraspora pellucida]
MKKAKNVKKIKSYPFLLSFAPLNNLIDHHVKDKQLLIHCPPECIGLPVQIYYDIFSQFLRDYHNEDLETREHYEWTLEFINGMAEIYCNNSSNDSVLESNVFSKSVLHFLVEMKNEIGTSSCDPTIQATGPWVCILGAVYVEKPIIDPLMDFIPLIPTNNRAHTKRAGEKLLLSLHGSIIVEHTNYVAKLEKHQNYSTLTKRCRDEYKMILRDVKKAIDKLHKENIVFADLCDSNILVNKSKGKEEIECYPTFMNHKHINWLPGAEDRRKLNCKHDVYWLELLKSKYLGENVDLE